MSLQSGLSVREIRGLHFLRRTHRWLFPVLVVLVWFFVAAGTWYKLEVIVEYGAPHGIHTFRDIYSLAKAGLPADRMISPYEAFVVSQASSSAASFHFAFVFTVFALCIHAQNRLILRLAERSSRPSENGECE